MSPQDKVKELQVIERSEQKPGCEIRKESGKEGGRVTDFYLPSFEKSELASDTGRKVILEFGFI